MIAMHSALFSTMVWIWLSEWEGTRCMSMFFPLADQFVVTKWAQAWSSRNCFFESTFLWNLMKCHVVENTLICWLHHFEDKHDAIWCFMIQQRETWQTCYVHGIVLYSVCFALFSSLVVLWQMFSNCLPFFWVQWACVTLKNTVCPSMWFFFFWCQIWFSWVEFNRKAWCVSDNIQQLEQQTIDQFNCNDPQASAMSASEQPVSNLLPVCLFCNAKYISWWELCTKQTYSYTNVDNRFVIAITMNIFVVTICETNIVSTKKSSLLLFVSCSWFSYPPKINHFK